MSEAYVSVRAQYENLGDLEIRRRLVRWAEVATSLHVLAGDAPQDWVAALRLPAHARVHATNASWSRSYLMASRPAAMLWSPGEYSYLGVRSLGQQAAGAVVAGSGRLRGLTALRVGRSLGRAGRANMAVERINTAATRTWWRDEDSRRRARGGALMPDIAFEEPPTHRDGQRHHAVLSFRGDKAPPGDGELIRLAAAVRAVGLEPLAVSQVRRDDDAVRHIRDLLGCEALPFGATAHEEHEQLLVSRYADTSLVVSDRFHVLVLAARGGAVPLGVESAGGNKLRRNLGTIGLEENVVTDVAQAEGAVAGVLEPTRVEQLRARLEAAASRVGCVRKQVERLITG